jgi:hypothetical protein
LGFSASIGKGRLFAKLLQISFSFLKHELTQIGFGSFNPEYLTLLRDSKAA